MVQLIRGGETQCSSFLAGEAGKSARLLSNKMSRKRADDDRFMEWYAAVKKPNKYEISRGFRGVNIVTKYRRPLFARAIFHLFVAKVFRPQKRRHLQLRRMHYELEAKTYLFGRPGNLLSRTLRNFPFSQLFERITSRIITYSAERVCKN